MWCGCLINKLYCSKMLGYIAQSARVWSSPLHWNFHSIFLPFALGSLADLVFHLIQLSLVFQVGLVAQGIQENLSNKKYAWFTFLQEMYFIIKWVSFNINKKEGLMVNKIILQSWHILLPFGPAGPGRPMPGTPESPFIPVRPGRPGCPGWPGSPKNRQLLLKEKCGI